MKTENLTSYIVDQVAQLHIYGKTEYIHLASTFTVRKVSVFGVILVCIFSRSDLIPRDTPFLSELNPNAGKYGPE